MVRQRDVARIEKIEKSVTKRDLVIYNKLHRLLRGIYKLESKNDVSLYDRIKAKEREVLRIIKQIRRDTIKELRFAQILKPKNGFQQAIVDIFGPFLSPEPVAVGRAEYVLKNDLGIQDLGVSPGGQPSFTHHGNEFGFGGQSYANGGDPHANMRAFGPALARAEGLEGPEAEARSEYANKALARALHGNLDTVKPEYRPAGETVRKDYQPASI